VAEFSGGTISSDAGGLLLQETDAKIEVDPIGWTKKRPFLDGAAG
jgi:hypothetical protein